MINKIRDPREQLINELCDVGNLEPFRDTLKLLLNEIFNAGARVSTKYNEHASNIDPNSNRPEHIRVSMLEVKLPLNIIWNILHEYGHYLDWPRKKEDTIVQREITAWDNAHEELLRYPQLSAEISSFNDYKEWCLGTYYKKYGRPIKDETT